MSTNIKVQSKLDLGGLKIYFISKSTLYQGFHVNEPINAYRVYDFTISHEEDGWLSFIVPLSSINVYNKQKIHCKSRNFLLI